MREFTILLAASVLAAGWATDASATTRHKYHRHAYSGERYARSYGYRRPASVGPNGVCQRDTGTPTSELNFRNRCDTQEFWARQNEKPRLPLNWRIGSLSLIGGGA